MGYLFYFFCVLGGRIGVISAIIWYYVGFRGGVFDWRLVSGVACFFIWAFYLVGEDTGWFFDFGCLFIFILIMLFLFYFLLGLFSLSFIMGC